MGKILLVDDDEILSNMYATKLKKVGFDVITISDGAEAINFLSKNQVDLLVLDIVLPTQNGIMVLKNIRKIPKLRNLGVIVLTNLTHADLSLDEQMKQVLDIKHYLIKSKTTPSKLLEIIRETTDEKD